MYNKIPLNQIEVLKEERSDGKQPRGWGYWIFKIGDQEFQEKGMYSACVLSAKKCAQSMDIYSITVLS
jgi:hypothetical protein